MSATLPPPEKRYFIDPENAAEMARLTHQDRLVTQAMGGLFPERSDLSCVRDVLDIACGPGEWPLSVATTYPHMRVVGIDISSIMIAYAAMQAQVRTVDNVTFSVMDALQPFDFPTHTFDLINARFIFGFMSPAAWPGLMEQCVRIARPGGTLRLTESEWNLTNSLAYETLHAFTTQALKKAGKSFSPDGRNIGITPMLGSFLQKVGCTNIQQAAFAQDLSADTEANQTLYQNLMAFFKLVEPFVLGMGITTQMEFDTQYARMLEEISSSSFRAISFILTVWGQTLS
jgi:ubiquinone/menaquinone biosynthesis C-methylase UbiE